MPTKFLSINDSKIEMTISRFKRTKSNFDFNRNGLNSFHHPKVQQNSFIKVAKTNLRPMNVLNSSEMSKQQVVSITYEEIGLFPRSFNRVFDRFLKQLFFDVEKLVLQEYRFYRYLFLTTLKCIFVLIFVPTFVNFLTSTYLIHPMAEYYWNIKQPEIFLNAYQQKEAFLEIQEFEEKIYFESLIFPSKNSDSKFNLSSDKMPVLLSPNSVANETNDVSNQNFLAESTVFEERLKEKITELAIHYNQHSIDAITHIFADLFGLLTLLVLFSKLEIQINITKSFLSEVFFGLDDSKKSLLILFLTDLLVGYHSPNIWEFFFQFIFHHYGLPENQTSIFLMVATLPVLLDVLFKYLIFRHLNRASPATVATYHAMIE
jgi:hypothetical protein